MRSSGETNLAPPIPVVVRTKVHDGLFGLNLRDADPAHAESADVERVGTSLVSQDHKRSVPTYLGYVYCTLVT
jgi:hypothetical protein